MKRVIIALLTSVALLPVHADKVWTLQECISYAVAHNLIIKQQEANVKQQEISLSTSRNSRLPNLSGSVGESFNFGRALTANNTYANRNTQSTNFSLSTNVPLFTGGQIPADIKGNVNPELTILLTGTVPKGAYQPVTIWKSKGIKESYDWHDYIYTSWTGQWENIRIHLKEAVNRKDHHVRINVCKGTPQKHIDRIKSIMQECNVTNYEIVKQ